MISNISNMLNSRLRLTGMASGLDTDSIIQQLMQIERSKVDKVKQERQLLEWKRDDYRSITSLVKSFKDSFMDVLSTKDMRSSSNYKAYKVSSSDTSAVTATATANAIASAHTITVTQLAKAAGTVGTETVSSQLQSSEAVTDLDFTGGKDFSIILNGITKKITIAGSFESADELKTYLQAQMDSAFGSGKISVGNTEGQISFSSSDSKITLVSGTTDALAQLNIASGSTNRLNLTSKLSEINMPTAPNGIIAFKINDVSFEYDSTVKTMKDLINEVNNSNAGVILSYSEATDKFSLTSKVKGAGDAIKIEEVSGGMFGAGSKLGISTLAVNNGQDAVFELDGTVITRNDNNFVLDGVSYSLMKENVTVSLNVEQNVDEIYDNIKNFVDKYNELIAKINSVIREERDTDYMPLTDAQKEAMSEKDIEKWEAKAKAGMLRNDSILSGMLTEMRNAMYGAIEGIEGGIYSIGIKTGTYTQQGKLIIDETKLKDAIRNTPDLVASIFSKESDIRYSVNMSSEDRQQRYKENGIVQRLYDIIQKNITTVPNADGNRGLLIERAGSAGDSYDITSYISRQINIKADLIDTMLDKLYDKEDQYYAKFAAMEKALSQMNSQSSWLMQQFGSGQ